MSYDNYDSFGEKFGHLFYTKQKFKNYHLKLDYRFYGEHANKFKNEMKHGIIKIVVNVTFRTP